MQHLLEFLCLGVDLCLEGGVGLVEVESGSLLLLQLLLHLTLLALQQHHQRVSHNTTSVSVTTPPACQSQHHQRVSHNTTSVSVTTPPACQSQHHQRVSHNTTSVSVTTPPACQSQHHQRDSHNTTSMSVTSQTSHLANGQDFRQSMMGVSQGTVYIWYIFIHNSVKVLRYLIPY